jgi:hypothetical protein
MTWLKMTRITNTLAYSTINLITVAKSFVAHAPGMGDSSPFSQITELVEI